MAYTYDIDKAKPPDTGESPSLGARVIRYFKEAVIERLQNLIYGFGSDAETEEGFKKVPLVTRSAPAQEADKSILYAKDVSGIAELFVRDENGVEMQVTSNGKINAGIIDHGTLLGLADDDHNIYYNAARHTKALHDALAIDHGSLGGKADDDHSQYLTTGRHDTTTRHPKSVIKTGTGSSTGLSASTDITMQDYCFFPNVHRNSGSGSPNLYGNFTSAPADYVGRFRVDAGGGKPALSVDVYWRYLSASGPPEIWIVRDDTRGLYAIWECDDPAPEGKPPMVCHDENGNEIGETFLIIPPDNFAEMKAKAGTKKIGKILQEEWEIDQVSNPARPEGLDSKIIVKTLKKKAK